MHFEKEGNDGKGRRVLREEGRDAGADERMQFRFEGLAFRGVRKNLGGEALPFGGVGEELMDDLIGVDRLEPQVVQKTRQEGFATGNPSRQTDFGLSRRLTPPPRPPALSQEPPRLRCRALRRHADESRDPACRRGASSGR